MIDKRNIHFKTQADFKAKLDAGEIPNDSIVYIKETHQVYTHGDYYGENTLFIQWSDYTGIQGAQHTQLTEAQTAILNQLIAAHFDDRKIVILDNNKALPLLTDITDKYKTGRGFRTFLYASGNIYGAIHDIDDSNAFVGSYFAYEHKLGGAIVDPTIYEIKIDETKFTCLGYYVDETQTIDFTPVTLNSIPTHGVGTGYSSEIFNYKGNVAEGEFSHAEGNNTVAKKSTSHAEGSGTIAGGSYSHAEGYNTEASGNCSHAEGSETLASGEDAHAEGYNTTASGIWSHSEGYRTKANGTCSHAEGKDNEANGICSHVEGQTNYSNGDYSHSEGGNTRAKGMYSHAEGSNTITNNKTEHAQGQLNKSTVNDENGLGTHFSHGIGYFDETGIATRKNALEIMSNGDIYFGTYGVDAKAFDAATKKITMDVLPLTTNGDGSKYLADNGEYKIVTSGIPTHGVGTGLNSEIFNNLVNNKAIGEYSHAEGFSSMAVGNCSHAEGVSHAEGEYSHAEGSTTHADGESSHAEGRATTAKGKSSHAEGNITNAIGNFSHTEGSGTNADGESSHAEGYATTAIGKYSHAEGNNTTAVGNCSHTEGERTITNNRAEHAQGRSNNSTADDENGLGTRFSHGIGTNANRKNALEIMSNGDIYFGTYNVDPKAFDAATKKLTPEVMPDNAPILINIIIFTLMDSSTTSDVIKNALNLHEGDVLNKLLTTIKPIFAVNKDGTGTTLSNLSFPVIKRCKSDSEIVLTMMTEYGSTSVTIMVTGGTNLQITNKTVRTFAYT